jgi:hypothetical protein
MRGSHVGHAQHAFEHLPGFGLDQLALLGIGQRGDQLRPRIGARRDELDQSVKQGALVLGGTQVPRGLGV